MDQYNAKEVESRSQAFWRDTAAEPKPILEGKDKGKKFYCLDMFPYPSENGLHVGNIHGFVASDVYCRMRRMQGYNVFHPIGWDAFGLPTEQHAVVTGEHPAEITRKNCELYKGLMQRLGLSYDWEYEINTSDPSYYKWTQWIFLKLYDSYFDKKCARARPISELPIPAKVKKKGQKAVADYQSQFRLAYFGDAIVNWCPELGTVLSNEEVVNGRSVRGGHAVVRRPMKQWLLRITEYSERLLTELEDIDWPESIKEQQRNWIGKKFGTEIDFAVYGTKETISVFTPRADTLFGVTFLVLSPEHPLVSFITKSAQKEAVEQYCEKASHMSELARVMEVRKKTGVFTGSFAVNPISQEVVPIYIGNYVLMTNGTGAVMGAPAHDDKDFDFARTFDLEIRPVIAPFEEVGVQAHEFEQAVLEGEVAYAGDGVMIAIDNPTFISLGLEGKRNDHALHVIVEWLVRNKKGRQSVQHRLRDWVFSRQRYWGEPIPMIHWDDGSLSMVDEADLPVKLPELDRSSSYTRDLSTLTGDSVWQAVADFKNHCKGRRETFTMPQWAGSCWYYLRYLSPNSSSVAWSSEIEREWMPVDLYVGTADHAVLHLLYVRFWHKILFDLGYVSTREPFTKLYTVGHTQAACYRNTRGEIVPVEEIATLEDGKYVHGESAESVERVTAKMSRTNLNIVALDEMFDTYGADSLRISEMFVGPLESTRFWDNQVLVGASRFLKRTWNFVNLNLSKESSSGSEISVSLLGLVSKVSREVENLRLNKALSLMMEFLNEVGSQPTSIDEILIFIKLLSPFAPHLAEELWQRAGQSGSIFESTWPTCREISEKSSSMEDITVIIQINGRKKASIQVEPEISDVNLRDAAVHALRITKSKSLDRAEFITVFHQGTKIPRLVNIVLAPSEINGNAKVKKARVAKRLNS